MKVDVRGMVLTENVDLNWLNNLEPRFYPDFVKFVVDKATNRVAVGMDIHASAKAFFGNDETNLYGGNIYRDGSIIYESTLNIDKNLEINRSKQSFWSKLLKKGNASGNPRIITDKATIAMINATLFSWIKL
jgi:hypothetical protein